MWDGAERVRGLKTSERQGHCVEGSLTLPSCGPIENKPPFSQYKCDFFLTDVNYILEKKKKSGFILLFPL